MIVVSGTGRSGTSMWMQVLRRTGLPCLGEAFPRDWATRLVEANPHGFFESTLTLGVNFTTNPDPATGLRLVPEETRDLVVKIFAFGVRRTERAFLDRVLVTVRHWRSFARSVERMWALDGIPPGEASTLPARHPAATWFREHHELLRDSARRGYDSRCVTYEHALRDPEHVVAKVLKWLGVEGDASVLAAAIDRRAGADGADGAGERSLPSAWTTLFDELHDKLDRELPWTPSFAARMDALRREMDLELSRPSIVGR